MIVLQFGLLIAALVLVVADPSGAPNPSKLQRKHPAYFDPAKVEALIAADMCDYDSLLDLKSGWGAIRNDCSMESYVNKITSHMDRCGQIIGQRIVSVAREKLKRVDLYGVKLIADYIAEPDQIRLANMYLNNTSAQIIIGALRKMKRDSSEPLEQFYSNHLKDLEPVCRELEKAIGVDALNAKYTLWSERPRQYPADVLRWSTNEMICNFHLSHIIVESPEMFISSALSGKERQEMAELEDLWPVVLSSGEMKMEASELETKHIEQSIRQYVSVANNRFIKMFASKDKLRDEFRRSLTRLRRICKWFEPLEDIVWLMSAGVPYKIPTRLSRSLTVAHACKALPSIKFESLEKKYIGSSGFGCFRAVDIDQN